MGYSGRYHAASLVAVFVALAVGILIGIGLADDVVSTASEELEASLRSDLAAAEERRDELDAQLEREGDFASMAVPALVARRLAGDDVGIVTFGEVPDDSVADVEGAVEAAGAELDAVARVAEPADLRAIAEQVAPRARGLVGEADGARSVGERAGATLVSSEGPGEALKETMFDGFNGSFADVDRVVFLSAATDEEEGDESEEQARVQAAFEAGVVDGIYKGVAAAVAAERTGTDPTTLGSYADAGIPTVDHLDLPAGKVSLVLALAGERGNYGIKDGATTFMPDLLDPGSGP